MLSGTYLFSVCPTDMVRVFTPVRLLLKCRNATIEWFSGESAPWLSCYHKMKDFRTELKIVPSNVTIDLKSGILTQGSCFSDAIGGRLGDHKLNVLPNPFGVIYNPESIHSVLLSAVCNEPMPDHTFLQNGELHLNYRLHSEFATFKKEELSVRLTNLIGSTHYFLKDCQWLIVTYGTAWVYSRNDTGEIVANCHKLPASAFAKSLMSVEDIIGSFRRFYEHLKAYNPGIRVVLTVSPVRHIRDTVELNSVSKSVLRLACHEITRLFDDVGYFPAYEIMMDDLRDYRFYKRDMIHPSDDAEDYIWEKFAERYFSPELSDFVQRWEGVLAAMRHRPFHGQSAAHRQFIRNTMKKLEAFSGTVDVSQEISVLKRQLETPNE